MSVEEPQRDQPNSQASGRKSALFQDSFVLYNNNYASIRFGFGAKNPYINIAKVIESQKGRRPVAGQQMFDNEHSIFFAFNLHELVALEKNFDKLVSGKMDAMQFIHDSKGDSNKKVMIIGCDISEDEKGFGIAVSICPTERTGQIIFDDPIDSAIYFPTEKEVSEGVVISDLEIIKRWITIAIESKLDTSALKSYSYNGGNFNRDRGGYNGGGNRFGNFRRGNNNGGDNGDEDNGNRGGYRDRGNGRPVIGGSRFGGGNNRPQSATTKEDAENLFDADEAEIMG